MKLIDLLISGILKKGILYEARNLDTDIDIPEQNIKVNVKCDHMTLRIEKN